MSVEEGFKSIDVEVIKEARGVAKGKVSKNIKSLKSALISETNKFLFDEIDEGMVQAIYEKLDTCHDTFQDLHERFCFFRTEKDDTVQENAAKEKEDSYSNQVSTEFCSIRREFVRYKKAAEDSARSLQIILLADNVDAVKKQLEGKKEAAKTVIDSEDVDIKKTAKLVKSELNEALVIYTSKVDEHRSALKSVKESGTPAVNYSEDINEVEDLKVKLESISIKKSSSI